MEQYKYALYQKFREPRLYRYAAAGDWDKIPRRCRSHPREAKFVHKYAPCDTALHRLLRPAGPCVDCDMKTRRSIGEMKVQAVSALLTANPTAASAIDSFGRTPLHLACMDASSSAKAVELLLDEWPKATSMRDINGRTPLHYLLSRNERVPLSLLEKLVSVYPQSASVKDCFGSTAVDIIQAREDDEHKNCLLQIVVSDEGKFEISRKSEGGTR